MGKPQEITVYVGTCLSIGVATIEKDAVCREMLCIRLTALPVDGTISIPLADLLVAAQAARGAENGAGHA